MNEEWYNDQLRLRQHVPWVRLIFLPIQLQSYMFPQRPNYEIWLNQIISVYQALTEGTDKTFSRFLLDLPAIPPDVFDLLRDFSIDFER